MYRIAAVFVDMRPGDLVKLREKGVSVYAVADDLAERGIEESACVQGVEIIGRGEIASLMERHDRIWHW